PSGVGAGDRLLRALAGGRRRERQRDGHAVSPREERRRRTSHLRELRRHVQLMLAKRIIPCLDVDAGRVVKGVRFQNLRDAGDPVELAARYDADGADELVFLDITATVEGRAATDDVIARTAEQVFIPLTVGGGVRDPNDVRRLLRTGADKVALNTAAVRDPELLSRCADTYGAQCVVIAIDAARRDGGW